MAAMWDAPHATPQYHPDYWDASICIVSHFLILTAGNIAFLEAIFLAVGAASALNSTLEVFLMYCSKHVRLSSFVTKVTCPQCRAYLEVDHTNRIHFTLMYGP
jgi:hypothetical protein